MYFFLSFSNSTWFPEKSAYICQHLHKEKTILQGLEKTYFPKAKYKFWYFKCEFNIQELKLSHYNLSISAIITKNYLNKFTR